MRIFAGLALGALLRLTVVPVYAQAGGPTHRKGSVGQSDKPFYYEADGIYIKATSRKDVCIGVTGGMRLSAGDKYKTKVKFYDASQSEDGYAAKQKPYTEPFFILNDTRTEMMVEDKDEGKDVIRCMSRVEGDVKVALLIEQDGSNPKAVMWSIPSRVRKEMASKFKRRHDNWIPPYSVDFDE